MSIEPVELFYKEYGDGPPLIILHGLLGASGNWHSLAKNVFGKDFTVYAIDLRNHGRSPHSDAFDFPTMAADLFRFFEARSLREASVLGHSMGGKAAMQLALTDPGLVTKLIAVDVGPKAYPPYHQEILDALRAVDPAQVSTRTDVDEALSKSIREAPVRQFLLKNLSYDSESGRYSWQMGLDEIYANYSAINQAIPGDRSYEGPALFVRGERSHYLDPSDLKDIKHLFPRARMETVSGAGHWVHADAPDEFADVVVDFLME